MIQLLSLLSPKSPSFTRTSSATGSRIGSADVAAALGMLSDPISVLILKAKHVGYSQTVVDLSNKLAESIQIKAALEGWRTWSGDDVWLMMARGVVDEYLNERTRCGKCDGSGIGHSVVYGIVDCDRCGGSGQDEPNVSERARCIGVSRPTYRDIWHKRWEWAVSELTRLEIQGEMEFNRQFR